MSDSNIRLAISVVGYSDLMPKYDPKYVQIVAEYIDFDEFGNLS